MSQVVVTDDKFREQRQRSKSQESKISQDEQFKKWKMSDITGKDPIATAIGFAALPLVAIWSVLFAFMSFALLVFVAFVKGMANIWKKN